MKLTLKDFSRLPGRNWIWNAVVPVKEGVRLSVSFSEPGGLWAVGDIGSYEVAIQVNSGHEHGWSLAYVEGDTNVFNDCDEAELDRIFALAQKVKLVCQIDAFAQWDAKEPRWGHRFDCIEGKDMEDKIAWCKKVFDQYRINYL
jgi:hypothetical protein